MIEKSKNGAQRKNSPTPRPQATHVSFREKRSLSCDLDGVRWTLEILRHLRQAFSGFEFFCSQAESTPGPAPVSKTGSALLEL
jgi:hypothetical protein